MGDLLQLVIPEQLRAPIVEKHVEGDVVGISPPFLDRANQSSQGRTKMVCSYPHPLADPRFLRVHARFSRGDLCHRRWPLLLSLSRQGPRSLTYFAVGSTYTKILLAVRRKKGAT